jgi:hypothetical protein
MHDVSNIE